LENSGMTAEQQLRKLEAEALGEAAFRQAARLAKLTEAVSELVEWDGAEFTAWWVARVILKNLEALRQQEKQA
jgi:hypothetical protein